MFYLFAQLYQSLARLIAENLSIQRWLLKIDNEIDGRGTGNSWHIYIYMGRIIFCLKADLHTPILSADTKPLGNPSKNRAKIFKQVTVTDF